MIQRKKYFTVKTFCAAMAAVIVLIALFLGGVYSRVAMVTSVEEDNLVTVACANGNAYSFFGDDWTRGDFCALIMFDNFTENVSDDVVISARYGGYMELFEKLF